MALALLVFAVALLVRWVASKLFASPYPFLAFFPAAGLATFFGGLPSSESNQVFRAIRYSAEEIASARKA